MGFISRLFGICRTKPPIDPDCWSYQQGAIHLDLGRTTELQEKAGAIRLEGKGLSQRVLVFRGDDGELHAFPNYCTHGKRRLDPVAGSSVVECCSVGKSRFDYQGERLSGSATSPIAPLDVSVEGDRATIRLS
ncbi:MAG: Rieske 2Fe-2S domain-containing protein [Bradymonadales bacterium]|nr:Rieske 2Fe-2S domain-containing protein [Bradymonadales bacterium]